MARSRGAKPQLSLKLYTRVSARQQRAKGKLEFKIDRRLMDLREHSRVRIRQLLRSPDAYDDLGWGVRPPQVGDIGIVLSAYQHPDSPEGYCYTVECAECIEPGGAPLWLGDFSAEELEAVHS